MTEEELKLAYPEQIFRQLAQYGIVANGTAIALFLGAVTTSAGANISASVGKVPLWLFFAGLLSGGLHLIFFMFYDLARQAAELDQSVRDLASRIDSSTRDCSDYPTNDPSTLTLQSRAGKNVEAARNLNQDPNAVKGLRHLQELSLWASLIFFIVGLALLISFVDVGKPQQSDQPSYYGFGSRIV